MTIKSILVPLNGSPAGQDALDAACMLAAAHGAHVDVLHVRTDPKDAVPLLGEGMSGAVIEDIVNATEQEAARRAADARAMYDKLLGRDGVSEGDQPSDGAVAVSWHEIEGREDETVALQGRLADLIVLNRPTEDASVSATMTLHAALSETGRGVMLVPPGGVGGLGKKVAIAWNGSAEAARSVAAAMPEIVGAEKVLVLAVDLDQSGKAMATDLGAYLKKHGVTAEIETTPAIEHNVGETVMSKCADWGADLLVMGAYTHSRLRQLIMGGVTRHVLDNATIPVVLVH